MAGPITWQNVNGASLADALRPMESAQRSFNGAFDGLGELLKQRQVLEEQNWQNGKVNNTNAALNAVNQFATPEEFQAAQKSGVIAQLMAANGAQMDQQAVRAAADGRLGILQQRAKLSGEYQDAAIERAAAPFADAYKAATLSGDRELQLGAWEQYQKAGGKNSAALLGANDARNQEITGRGRETVEFTQKGEKHARDGRVVESNLLTDVLQRRLLGAQANESANRSAALKLESEAKAYERESGKTKTALMDKRYAEFIANSPLDQGDISTGAGKKALYTALKDLGVSEAQKSDILFNLDKYYKEGVPVGHDDKGNPIRQPLPVSVVVDAIQGSSDSATYVPFMSRRGDDVVNKIDERFGISSNGRADKRKQATKDQALISFLGAAAELRNRREAPLLAAQGSTPVRFNPPTGQAAERMLATLQANADAENPPSNQPGHYGLDGWEPDSSYDVKYKKPEKKR